MNHRFLLFLFMVTGINAHAQFEDPSWVYMIDAFNDADITDVEVDDKGNTYASVNYMGTLNLVGNQGRLLPNADHQAGVLLKLDSNGKLLWCRGFESAFDNRINDIVLGADGSVYFTGFGDGLVHFPGKKDELICGREKEKDESHQPQGIYAAKYTSEGERIWVHFWSSPWGEGRSVAVNSKGELAWSYYHCCDIYEKDVLIDIVEKTDRSQMKMSIAFFNADGSLKRIEHVQTVESFSTANPPVLYCDKEDNLYRTGTFTKCVFLTPQDSLVNDGYYDSQDAYLAKYNPEGELMWSRQFGGQNTQRIYDIDFGSDGSVYGTGQFSYECLLMDAIKSIQKSKFDYKSGDSMFYFHFFKDGECDFIRFDDNEGYSNYFISSSIDIDLNEESHIVGLFTDTLRLEGFVLKEDCQANSAFYSNWKGRELQHIVKIGTTKSSWLHPLRVRSGKQHYAIGAMYYGKDVTLEIAGKKIVMSSVDYGRASFIYGGAVKRKDEKPKVLAEMQMRKRTERLDMLKPLLACPNPQSALASVMWYPASDSIPENDSTLVAFSPCGYVVENMEASLYPNPTKGPVSVLLKGMKDATTQIEVFSESGKLMYSQRLTIPSDEYTVDFDMAGAATGLYFVRIVHGAYEKALKVVKLNM